MLSFAGQALMAEPQVAHSTIETGEIGKCLECRAEITKKRLDVLPLTEHCIKCQTDLENIEEEYE